MAIDLKSLKNLEAPAPSAIAAAESGGKLLSVLVKIKRGAARPSYFSPRSEITSNLFSAQVDGSLLSRLEADPAVESVAISRRLSVID